MFETVLGIPAHPLIIHAAVVFIPLLIAGAIVYPLVPRVRDRIRWAVLSLAVIAPLAALAAKLSGQAFRTRLIRRHLTSADGLRKIDQHMSYGNNTLYLSIALGVVALVLIGYAWFNARNNRPEPPRAYWWGGAALAVVLGVLTGYYVFKTGDSGAHITWTGF